MSPIVLVTQQLNEQPYLQGFSLREYDARQPRKLRPFPFIGSGFLFRQIVSIRVKKLSNTNLVASRHIKREKGSLPVDVRRSKTLLLPVFSTEVNAATLVDENK